MIYHQLFVVIRMSDLQKALTYSGWEAQCPPPKFLPCCAKTVYSRLMKLSDFQYNYTGHHLKLFPVDSNLRCCHDNAFVKEHLVKMSVFDEKWPFSRSKLIHIEFLVQIRNQRLKIDSCVKFQPDWTKDKGAQISTWNDTKNCLMTSYLLHSDDVSKISRAFERFCPRVLSCQVWY